MGEIDFVGGRERKEPGRWPVGRFGGAGRRLSRRLTDVIEMQQWFGNERKRMDCCGKETGGEGATRMELLKRGS
jgi:hypothetical protein